MVIARRGLLGAIQAALDRSPVVVLTGPRQCGKTTLARELAPEDSTRYFDLEDPAGGIPGFETSGGSFRRYSWLPGFRKPRAWQDTTHPLLDKLDYLQAVAPFLPLDAIDRH